jgi:hypothetical protein
LYSKNWRAVTKGKNLNEGDVVANVSSRPIFLLQGEFESYRSMSAGSKGLDVEQLDGALSRMGLLKGKANDTFDAATQAALVQLYKNAGYEVTGPSEEEQTQLREAQKELNTARSAYNLAISDISNAKVSEAKNLVASAQSTYDEALAKANTDNIQAAQELSNANSVVTQSSSDLSYKQSLLTTAQSGINPYNNTVPSSPEESSALGQIVSTLTIEVNELIAKLDQANGDVVVKQAKIESTKVASAASVARAKTELTNAQDKLNDVLNKAANTSSDPEVKAALSRLDAANSALSELSAKTGVKVPLGEIVFVSNMPAVVNSVMTSRGQKVQGALLNVSSNTITVNTSVAKADIKFVSVGQKVEIIIDGNSKKIDGIVSTIATSTGTDGAGEDRYAVVIEPAKVDKDDTGASVEIAIPVKTTKSKVLAVPLAAVSVDGDGRPRVEIVDDAKNHKSHFVSVQTGLRAQGYVEIITS